jgi:putative transposase
MRPHVSLSAPRQRAHVLLTVVAHRRRPILCDDLIRTALRRGIETVRATRPFSIDAWVLLTDYMHCIWTLPEHDTDFSLCWSEIKRREGVYPHDWGGSDDLSAIECE